MPGRWGPFSGRQLTVMFCALLAAIVLVPSTVYAVDAFTNVEIQDPATGNKAKVVSGALRVGGSVTAPDASPANMFRVTSSGVGGTTCQVAGTPPTGKAWVLTSLSLNIVDDGGTPFGPDEYVVVYSTSTCSYPYFAVLTPTQVGPHEFTFDPGVVIPNGGSISVALFNTSLTWEINANGYSVPASSVPAAVAPATGAHPHPGTPDP